MSIGTIEKQEFNERDLTDVKNFLENCENVLQIVILLKILVLLAALTLIEWQMLIQLNKDCCTNFENNCRLKINQKSVLRKNTLTLLGQESNVLKTLSLLRLVSQQMVLMQIL